MINVFFRRRAPMDTSLEQNGPPCLNKDLLLYYYRILQLRLRKSERKLNTHVAQFSCRPHVGRCLLQNLFSKSTLVSPIRSSLPTKSQSYTPTVNTESMGMIASNSKHLKTLHITLGAYKSSARNNTGLLTFITKAVCMFAPRRLRRQQLV